MDANEIPSKTIPSNLEAEEAVLGSLLIDPDAIIRVASFLQAEDFYREKHGWIYQAALDLHERREPVDFVTLCDELRRREQLQEVGGAAYITALINAVPTAVHVEHYAHIVERTAVLRRLISAAGRIAALAYEGSEDAYQVVDRAEQEIFGISERRIQRELVPIKQVMKEVIDRIEYLQQHQDGLLGVPTGFVDLDRLLGGLQKSDLIIIAGRPGMGKSSLAINIALHAARRHGRNVGLFSLEMSKEQLVQRLLASETEIDSQRLRLGRISEEDWPKLVEAAGVLADAPIFIDDTPAISPLELRTKARRLASEHDLHLLIVDYLQLMHTDMRFENRVQEISFISRSMKALARELEVPLIAISQLSRSVESRHDKRPLLSDLRECLPGDTLIVRADTGERVPIAELAAWGQSVPVWSLDSTLKLKMAWMDQVFPSGVKQVLKVRTRTGRAIRASGNHPFLQIDGWKRLDALSPGDFIAVPRIIPEPQQPRRMSYCGSALFKSGISRERMARISRFLPTPEISQLAESDVYWDQIESIEPDGEEVVYDGTVPGLHNLVANDFIVHNSGALEQDADVVIFIYRDDAYYTKDEWYDKFRGQDKPYPENVAEIIVAKHRHGPTKTIELYFNKPLTKFSDLVKRPLERYGEFMGVPEAENI